MLAKGKGRVERGREEREACGTFGKCLPAEASPKWREWNKGDKVKAPDKCSEDE